MKYFKIDFKSLEKIKIIFLVFTLQSVQGIAAKAHEATDTQAAGLLGKLHLGK